MANVKGRNIQVEVAATYAAAITGWTVSNASPGVASKTTHGVSNNTCGYWSSVTGMAQLEGQATRAKNVASGTMELQGLNTTNFGVISGTATWTPVATWLTLSEATGYRMGGGSSDKLDVTRLIDITKQEEMGLLPADSCSIDVIAQDTPSAAMAVLETAVQSQTAVLIRITLAGGAVRLFRGDPSLPGEDVRAGAVGTGSFDIAVKGFSLKLSA